MHLTTWEREYIRLNLGETKGLTVNQFRTCLSLLEKLELTEEEKTAIGYQAMTRGSSWEKVGYAADLQLEPAGLEMIAQLLSTTVRAVVQADSFDMTRDRNLLTLCQKLGIDFWQLIEEEQDRIHEAETSGRSKLEDSEPPTDA